MAQEQTRGNRIGEIIVLDSQIEIFRWITEKISRKKNEQSLRDSGNWYKRSNIHLTGALENRRKTSGLKKVPERTVTTVINLQIQEDEQTLRLTQSDSCWVHHSETPGNYRQNLKSCQSLRPLTCKEKTIQMTAGISKETIKSDRTWLNIFPVLGKKKNYQSRILGQAKLSFRKEAEMKTFSDERKLRIHYQQTYVTRMAKEISLKRWRRKESWNTKKKIIGKSVGKCQRLCFSSWVF